MAKREDAWRGINRRMSSWSEASLGKHVVHGVDDDIGTKAECAHVIRCHVPFNGHSDVNTSDAVYVYVGSAPTGIALGNIVNVSGMVTENVAHTDDLSTTEITSPTYASTGQNGTMPFSLRCR